MQKAFTKGILTAIIAGAALVFAPSFIASEAQASRLPGASTPTYDAGSARPIQGWIDFCQRNPGDCAVDTREPEFITLDALSWSTIVSVNRQVNAAIQPMTDMELYGVADYWDYPTSGYGDCEDYQLLKRKLLADAGIPRRAMRMTVVIDEKNEGHAVLMIRTDRGDFILDNKTDAVVAWHQTGYVYVKRESQHAVAWTSLGHTSSPVATANR
jgi:predicted transglutaminase-like cysteine proteinase